MIIISETKLPKQDIEFYHSKGYRVARVYDEPVINRGEAVGILMDRMYAKTIDLIGDLLYKKHKVSVKFEGTYYKLDSIDDWKRTYQSEKDQIKTTTERHYLYQLYLDRQRERREARELDIKRKLYNETVSQLFVDEDIPSDEELQIFIDTWSKAYDVQVDFNDKRDVLLKYKALKFYVDNNLDVSNRDAEPDIVYIGNENLFEDLVYNRDRQSEILSALGY